MIDKLKEKGINKKESLKMFGLTEPAVRQWKEEAFKSQQSLEKMGLWRSNEQLLSIHGKYLEKPLQNTDLPTD